MKSTEPSSRYLCDETNTAVATCAEKWSECWTSEGESVRKRRTNKAEGVLVYWYLVSAFSVTEAEEEWKLIPTSRI